MKKGPRLKARDLEARGQIGLGFSAEEMTRFPESSWVAPDLSSLPDRLAGATVGVDTETKDDGLSADVGPGWAWRGGHVAGYSISADNCKVYLPVGHPEGNVDPDQARRWLNHVLSDATQTKVFANAMYDIGWSGVDGVKIAGPVVDVQIVEGLLNEHRRQYSLESIAQDRLGRGKDETMLADAARAYGVDKKAGIHRMHPRFVGPYAVEDAELPRELWAVQEPLIRAEKLGGILDIEHRLLPMYMDMRRRGVRIDADAAEKMAGKLTGEVSELVAEVKRQIGIDVAIWEPESVARALDHIGVPYGRTPKNKQPSIKNEDLKDSEDPVAQMILQAREKSKLVGTFIKGQLLDQLHGGRVHGQIHPMKSDDGGTTTGRLSMSDPNLQFIPTRTEEGRLIRSCFIPEDGEEWGKIDVNQQEVRLLVHFAVKKRLPSALEARKRYVEDPTLNYHKFVAEITALVYARAKILNFAIIYGRGVAETADELGMTVAETQRLFDQHAAKMPFARSMANDTKAVVQSRGWIRSLLGRRQRFPFYEPASWDLRTKEMYPWDEAVKRWPNCRLVRARIHKALNSLIQPSAADQTKKAMLDVWDAGLGKYVMIQVHDELDTSTPERRIAHQVAEIMRDAVKLEVPVIVNVDFGANWGECS